MARLTDNEIISYLGRKIESSLNNDDGDISQARSENFNYYVGKPYGNERDGYSSVVTREVLETIEWAMPSILRVFTSGDRIVSYEPVGQEDEAQAEQETDIANHYALKENNGFLAIHHWVKDALLYPNGYIKLAVEDCKKSKRSQKYGIDSGQLNALWESLNENGEMEILGQESTVQMTELGPIETFDIDYRYKWTEKKVVLVPIPPEQLLVDADCMSIDLDEADCVIQRTRKTLTQLISDGYSRDELEDVGADDYDTGEERENRMFFEDEDHSEDVPGMQKFWVHECYIHIDTDDDGIAEHRRIVTIGDRIFENEEVDYQPFVALSSILMQHKHAGMPYADLVKDIQVIKTTLWRQLLDNIYKMNVRRKYVGQQFLSQEGGTLDVLLDVTSEFVPARDPMAIREEVVQPIVSDILPVIQGMSDLQNVRTGVSPQLSLDPSILQQSTMGAFRSALEEASQRIEMIVRIFAETGFRQLMMKMHTILRTYIDIEKTVRLRGEWITFNPSMWDERTNVSVNVGLGFNNKDQKISLLFQLLNLQKEAMAVNLSDPQKIYNALEEIVQAAGLGDAQSYFNDPSKSPPPPEPAPDPMLELAKADLDLRGKDLQLKAQQAQTDSERKRFEMELKQNELMIQMQKMQKELQNMEREGKLKEAQTLKTMEEARAQDIENDAVVKGVVDAIESINDRLEYGDAI
jgi:hypothetical protein